MKCMGGDQEHKGGVRWYAAFIASETPTLAAWCESCAEHAGTEYVVVSVERWSESVKLLVAEVRELLRNATFADGVATVRTQDCEALEAARRALTVDSLV